jgi:putative tryptophan/tyrosine transport system substrate-binding protein
MKRRAFVLGVGGAAAAAPLAAPAQQPVLPVVGLLSPGFPEHLAEPLAAFRKGLSETGYVEGRNMTFEFRWAHNDLDRLPDLAADLVRRRVAVIATPGSAAAAVAAKAATTTTPVVFSTGGDPVEIGLVASLNRPGRNVTGVSYMNAELGPKRLGLLHELVPAAKRFAALFNVDDPASRVPQSDVQARAAEIGLTVELLYIRNDRDIDAAFAGLKEGRFEALPIFPSPVLFNRRIKVLTLAARHAAPIIYPAREWAAAGGLMSYGSSFVDQWLQAGIYTARVLKGEKPADMPILRATKFEFVINLQAAKALGIDVPPTLLALADEVIE